MPVSEDFICRKLFETGRWVDRPRCLRGYAVGHDEDARHRFQAPTAALWTYRRFITQKSEEKNRRRRAAEDLDAKCMCLATLLLQKEHPFQTRYTKKRRFLAFHRRYTTMYYSTPDLYIAGGTHYCSRLSVSYPPAHTFTRPLTPLLHVSDKEERLATRPGM